MVDNKYVEIFKKIYSKNNNIEEALSELKKNEVSQMQCTRLLMVCLGLGLAEADKIVVNSKTWNDQLNSVNELRESFFNIDFNEEE